MALQKPKKTEIIVDYATKEVDTGSPEVQIALLTERINQLIEHNAGQCPVLAQPGDRPQDPVRGVGQEAGHP